MSTLLTFFLTVFLYSVQGICVEALANDLRSNLTFFDAKSILINGRNADNEISDEDDGQRESSWEFDYHNIDEWGQHSPSCLGTKQSPIDLESRKMTKLKVSERFRLNGYRVLPKNMTVVNNGHSVELSGFWDDKKTPYISGGVLTDDYVFQQLHFHWSSIDDSGSEHTLNNRTFPLEMHMVHYKRKYGSSDEAMKYDDGLAVMGIFFKIGEKQNSGIVALERIAKGIERPSEPIQIKPFALNRFTSRSAKTHMVYKGSLTTPPCSEIVTWIVRAVPNSITHKQLKFFQSIQLAHGDDHNFRPTQALNGRKIYYIRDYY